MRKSYMVAVLAALGLFISCFPAHADAPDSTAQYPLISLARVSVGLRGEYEWVTDNAPTIQEATARQFRVGPVMSYALVPHLAATFRATFALGSGPHYAVGANWLLFSGKQWAESHPEAVGR